MKKSFVLLALVLGACDSSTVRDTIGISRKAPDEFRVVARPPLSVPPDFNLRPPAAPGEETAATPARKQAEAAVLGEGGAVVLTPGNADTAVMAVFSGELETGADAQFLQNARADKVDASIREKLAQEMPAAEPKEKSLLEKLRDPNGNQPVVDAGAEKDRIKANKDEGKPVTEGETPMAKPKDTGPLGRLLGY